MPAAKPLKRLLSSNSVLRRSNTPIKPFNTISPRKLKTQDTDKAESRSVTDYVMLLYTNNYTQSLLQFFTIFASSGFVVSATIFLLFIYILSLIEDCASPESQGSISNIFSSVDTTDNSYCQAMSQSLWLPTKYSKIWVLNAKGWYANLETKQNGYIWTVATKLLPGYFAKIVVDRCIKAIKKFKEQYIFLTVGFQDRVAITLNAVVPSKKGEENEKMEFEMRTVRDLSIQELVPNDAAVKSIKNAGKRILQMEDGPSRTEWEENREACCGNKFFQKLFCIKAYSKTFCCCGIRRFPFSYFLPQWFCGKTKMTKYHCDPILRFDPKMENAKKFIQDQIINVLSSIFSGNRFIGWGTNMDAYETHIYYWCLTFEQTISNMEKKGEVKSAFQTSNFQNRKFRILVASKEVIDLAVKFDPWDVFKKKSNENYTKYCDRRWMHLRTMGNIIKRQEGKVDENDEDLTEKHKLYGDTFFCSKLEVVIPKPTNQQKRVDEKISLQEQISKRIMQVDKSIERSNSVEERKENAVGSQMSEFIKSPGSPTMQ